MQVNGEEARRIDWVGDPNHPQPQDPIPNQPTERYQAMNEAAQGPTYQNEIEDYDDLQQRQQPESIRPFGKGTYLEFVEQEKILKP